MNNKYQRPSNNWKKHHSPIWKQQKMREKKKKIHSNRTVPRFKTRKPMLFNKPTTAWKLPSSLLLVSLVMIILVVPTMIVVPFISNDGDESAAVEIDSTDPTSLETEDAAISVAVMRTQSEEIENVPLETYVSRVVASEMPAEFEMEALKSQALAARTYIVNHLLNGNSSGESDVTDTVQHQVYHNDNDLRKLWGKDYQVKMEKIKQAVNETKGQILTYEKAPITPAFFSTSNGFTENSEDYWENQLPYLRSVASPWDEESPKFLDQKTFTVQEVEKALEVDLPNGGTVPIEITRTAGKRINQLKIADHTFSGRQVREKLQLRSSDFTIKQKNDHFIFTTKGYGHGIGMSQYGANGMAKEGKNYEEIVKHYYQDVEISQVTDIAPTLVSKYD